MFYCNLCRYKYVLVTLIHHSPKSRCTRVSAHCSQEGYGSCMEEDQNSPVESIRSDGDVYHLAYYSFVCSIFNSGFFGCNLDRSSPVYSSMCGISFVSLFVLQVSHLKVIQNSTDPNQCLTTSKIVSTILVCVGIFIFTMGKQSIQSVSLSSESSQ